jgi:hypothetical protein
MLMQANESRRGGPLRIAVVVAMGALLGVVYWGWWLAALAAPAVERETGVPEGFVYTLMLVGSVPAPFLLSGYRGRRGVVLMIGGGGAASALTALAAASATGAVAVAVGALALLGAGSALVDTSVQWAAAARRPASLPALWLAKTATLAAGGPIVEALESRAGTSGGFWLVGLVVLLAAAGLVRLWPAPGTVRQRDDARALVPRRWFAVAVFCMEAQLIVFSQFLPLAAQQLGVEDVGGSQLAFFVGTVLTVAMGFILSGRRVSLIGAAALPALAVIVMMGPEACLVGTLGGVIVLRSAAAVAVAMQRQPMAKQALGNAALAAAAGAAGAAGSLVMSVAGGVIWSVAPSAVRDEALFVIACGLGVVGAGAASRCWRTVSRRSEDEGGGGPSVPSTGSGAR